MNIYYKIVPPPVSSLYPPNRDDAMMTPQAVLFCNTTRRVDLLDSSRCLRIRSIPETSAVLSTMSALPLLQFIVAVAGLTAATVAGCVLSRHIFRTAADYAAMAGDEQSERVARDHVRTAACNPAAASLFWFPFFGGGPPRRKALFYLPLVMFLAWRAPPFPAIRASYRRQAPGRVALLALMLWSGTCVAWAFCSFSMYSNARQFGSYDYFGPSRIVSFTNGGGEQDCTMQLMQLEWECHNSNSNGGAVQCDNEMDVVFSYQTNNVTFYYDKVGHHWFNVYNVDKLNCSSLAGAVEAADDDDAGSPTAGPYVDILGNCTGSSSDGVACSVPRLLGSRSSEELRLPRTYGVQGWILAGLAASTSLVSAYLAFRQQQQQQKRKKLALQNTNVAVIPPHLRIE